MPLDVNDYLRNGCGRCPLGSTPDCKVHTWTSELQELRKIALSCGLKEEIKWGVPCYTLNGKIVVMISALRDYCAVSFLKGVLIDDTYGLLEKPGNNSQVSRLIRVRRFEDILEKRTPITALVMMAIENEKAGRKVEFKTNPGPIPKELQVKLDEDPFLKTAFENLTPGRQRGYILHFSQPKQSKTREARIDKFIPMILNGEGMHDKYKSSK